MIRRLWVVVAVGVACACGDAFAPGHSRASLNLVPTFSENVYELLTGDLDRLRVQVSHIPGGATVIDTTVDVDTTTGSVDLDLTVTLLAQTDSFEVLLEGIRSSDNTVLYSGFDTVVVTAGAVAPPGDTIAVNYVGPCGATSGCTVTVAPQDSTLTQGDSVVMRVNVDSLGVPVPGVPVSITNLTPTLVSVSPTRHVRALTGTAGGLAQVAATIHGAADTLRLTVPPLGGAPAVVIVTPGYATLRIAATGNTAQLADTVKDGVGNLLSPALATWISRTPGVATVSSSGLVTATGRGVGVIVASAGAGVADSILVAVGDTAAPGDPLFVTVTNNRAFGQRTVGQTVAIDVVADLQAVLNDSLASYNARYTWDQTILRFDSTNVGTYNPAGLVVNADSSAGGIVRFADVDANGEGGARTLVRMFFTALGAGSDAHQLQITEVSGPSPNYVNFFVLNRYIAASGNAAIAP